MQKMKKIVLLVTIAGMLAHTYAPAQQPNYDKSMEYQLRSMELGDLEFSPKEYYNIFHGEPAAENLWQADSYSVYDDHWQWEGFNSHWELRLNKKKSKATPLNPLRWETNVVDIETKYKFAEMRDSVTHELQRQVSLAADCEIDLYYNAYKPKFDKYDNSITDLITTYLVKSGDGLGLVGDAFGIEDETLDEFYSIREARNDAHEAYMESTKKDEVYRDILERYQNLHKKMVWRVMMLNIKTKN